MFNFSLDTLLISCFGNYDSTAIIFDFETNNDVIPLILKANGHYGKIYGIEI